MSSSRSGVLRPRPPLSAPASGPGRGLLAGVCALLSAAAAGDLFSLYAGVRAHSAVDGDGEFAFVSEDRWAALDMLFVRVNQVQVLAFVACAAVFITWFHQVRRRAGALEPAGFRSGPGWAVGAWFVPVACFWLPYRIAVQAWTAGLRGAKGAFWPVNLWWASFACSVMLGQYASLRYRRAEDLGAFVDAVTLGMVADALNIVAAGAAVYFAVRLTRMLAPGDNPAQPAQPPRNA
ncbi:DUF4328 domain-containing protein [Streptomyces sp. NPDC059979]|uniref:DUF4328 domain-containing protein n=1 Tax=Streptomyces sp. NPDC059979 TaxID=3347021 RepID=UPI0036BB6363